MHDKELLKISNLAKNYGKQPIFTALDMSVRKGEWLGIVGVNGSGKSTLVKTIIGMEVPSAGEIWLAGQNQKEFNTRSWLKEVQLVTQYTRNALDPLKTIDKILQEPLKLFGLTATEEERRAQISQWLTYCTLPQSILTKRPRELSGGQYQRVCIILALLVNPQVLICDEATASLDRINELRMIRLLKAQTEKTVLFISHNPSLVAQFCDRCIFMENYKSSK